MIAIWTRTLLLLCLLVTTSCQPSLPKNVEPEIAYPVPEFAFVERGGKTVTKADLLGKVWVASFVFTRCSGPCPAVTATVARLQSELAHEPNVRFVTFTIDPDRDTPDELKKYADRFRADPERWLFLTGKEAIVHELATSGFKLLAMKKPGGAPATNSTTVRGSPSSTNRESSAATTTECPPPATAQPRRSRTTSRSCANR